MRVTHGSNTQTYQQQRTYSKDKDFANMFANMAANRHGKPDKANDGGHGTRPMETEYSHLRLVNPHKYLGMEIKLTAEQSAELDAMKKASPSGSESLEKSEEVDTTNFFVPKPYELPAPKYPASIYNIPADDLKNQLEAAEKACSALDTEGMSKAEIYNSIETIYKNYLGNDFRSPQLLFSGVRTPGKEDYEKLLCSAKFSFERFHGVRSADSDTIREARGYAGMSDSDIKAAVREQYPNVMTLKDCVSMAHELGKLGFEEEGAVGIRMIDRIFSTMGPQWSYGAQKIYESMLDMPADFDAFMSKYEAFAKNDYKRYLPQNEDEMFKELMSWVGGSGLYSQEMLNQIRDTLDEMGKNGGLAFDQIGYGGSPEK